jgi:hypothetical protein
MNSIKKNNRVGCVYCRRTAFIEEQNVPEQLCCFLNANNPKNTHYQQFSSKSVKI